MRFTGLFSTCLLAMIVFANPAAGQAMVEYGVMAGATATATVPASGLKNSIGGVFESLDKTMKSVQDPQGKADSKGKPSGIIRPYAAPSPKGKTPARILPAQAPLSSMVRPLPPPPNYEDPTAIQAGMGYDELLRRFGPPALEFTQGPSRKTVSYLSKSGAIQVVFQDGKVTSAEKPNL